jgi:predicted transposase YdaD
MLAANIEKMLLLEREKGIQQGIERGIERGREEGREDGVLEGKRASLLKLLAFKFGPASDERTQRVSLMLHDQLDRAIELVLIAQHEHEVFATTDHTP